MTVTSEQHGDGEDSWQHLSLQPAAMVTLLALNMLELQLGPWVLPPPVQ